MMNNQNDITLNWTYLIEQQFPPIVHIKMIANGCIKKKPKVKSIVFQKKISSRVLSIYICNALFPMHRVDQVFFFLFPSLITALIIVWNKLWYKSSSSMISHERDCRNILYSCGANKKYKLINKSFSIVNLIRIFFSQSRWKKVYMVLK